MLGADTAKLYAELIGVSMTGGRLFPERSHSESPKLWHIYRMEYYEVIREDEVL